MEVVDFSDFMKTEIFPGGFLPTTQMVQEHAQRAASSRSVANRCSGITALRSAG
jgi:cyclopropane fatty-acyl-phospholipid synthase-like methyltransferase